jgi:hypothetical protein
MGTGGRIPVAGGGVIGSGIHFSKTAMKCYANTPNMSMLQQAIAGNPFPSG